MAQFFLIVGLLDQITLAVWSLDAQITISARGAGNRQITIDNPIAID
jgi:hypothetical protein